MASATLTPTVAPGDYPVQVSFAADALYEASSASQTLTLSGHAPVAAFTFAPAATNEGESVQFTDASTDPDQDDAIVSWAWSFGGRSRGRC